MQTLKPPLSQVLCLDKGAEFASFLLLLAVSCLPKRFHIMQRLHTFIFYFPLSFPRWEWTASAYMIFQTCLLLSPVNYSLPMTFPSELPKGPIPTDNNCHWKGVLFETSTKKCFSVLVFVLNFQVSISFKSTDLFKKKLCTDWEVILVRTAWHWWSTDSCLSYFCIPCFFDWDEILLYHKIWTYPLNCFIFSQSYSFNVLATVY